MVASELDALLVGAICDFSERLVPRLRQACEESMHRRDNALWMREQAVERREHAVVEREKCLGLATSADDQRKNALAGAQKLARDLFKGAEKRSSSLEAFRCTRDLEAAAANALQNAHALAGVPSPSRAFALQSCRAAVANPTTSNAARSDSPLDDNSQCRSPKRKPATTQRWPSSSVPLTQRTIVVHPDTQTQIRLTATHQSTNSHLIGECDRGKQQVRAGPAPPLSQSYSNTANAAEPPQVSSIVACRRATVSAAPTAITEELQQTSCGGLRRVTVSAATAFRKSHSLEEGGISSLTVDDRKGDSLQRISRTTEQVSTERAKRGSSVPASRHERCVVDPTPPRRALEDLLRSDEEQLLNGVCLNAQDP